jgi:hypothetical protein
MMDTNPGSPKNMFRRRRFEWFMELIASINRNSGALSILDVGGTAAFWGSRLDRLGDRPVRVILANLELEPTSDSRVESIIADARDLSNYPDNHFDVVHSNSVIEHVGSWSDMMAMAKEISRVAPAYFVQTPYFWFPLEPHCRTAFFHWMPESWRMRLIMSKARGFWPRAQDVDTAMQMIQSNTLLDIKMFQALFPDAVLRREKIGPLTKSLVAIRARR